VAFSAATERPGLKTDKPVLPDTESIRFESESVSFPFPRSMPDG